MDATLAQIKVLSPERDHSACPIQSLPKEVKVMLFTRPPSLGRPASSTKKALTAIPLNQPHWQANTFHLSHDQNYLTKTLLTTTKVISLENRTKQTPYLTLNNQR